VINPEHPSKELEGFYPATWQALTGTDLLAERPYTPYLNYQASGEKRCSGDYSDEIK
jgi:hypothetical protein